MRTTKLIVILTVIAGLASVRAVAQDAKSSIVATAAIGTGAQKKEALSALRKLAAEEPKEALLLLRKGLKSKDAKVQELATNELLRIGSDEAMAILDGAMQAGESTDGKGRGRLNGKKTKQSPSAKLTEMLKTAEVRIAEKAVKGTKNIDGYRKQLATLQSQAAGTTQLARSDTAVAHVVSIYGASPQEGVKRETGFHPFGICTIKVTDLHAPVILVLVSYNRTRWRIELAEGAKLAAVHVHGYHDQWVVGVPKGVKVDTQSFVETKSGLWTGRTKPDHKKLSKGFARAVRKLAGAGPSTFFGVYRARTNPVEVGPGNDTWRSQLLLPRAVALLQSLEGASAR